MNITTIQFFNQTFENPISEFDSETIRQYSANVAIDDKFIIQLSGNDESCNVSIPSPDEMSWDGEEGQKWAYENLDAHEIMSELENMGVENNFDWLNENADELY
ncbi:hypothetical protein [Faucicola boevrei]|uniref:hypothetical protein n=1 Tax=Faucicola boevrei TaxID=346665 RepID=UPI00037B1BA9|nr:hypothetical protein [Moraxella boevrei]